MTATKLLEEARQLQESLIQTRRQLHAHPGTGFDLSETIDYVRSQLLSIGCHPVPIGRSGLSVSIGKASGSSAGKVFLLRADMDALPIREETSLPFASVNGNMHACGHDMHTAMLLGAARLLKAHESEIHGTVRLMFQPAEEIFEGAQDMIASGILRNPSVDAALMIHVMSGFPLPAGTVIVCDGGVSAPAADYFSIRVQGKGCHGSSPAAGVDPITAAAHILLALQEIAARELSASESAILTIGSIHAGQAANILPESAEMHGTLRTYSEDTRIRVKERLGCIASNVAAAFRATASVSFGSSCPTLVNDAQLSSDTAQYVEELLGKKAALTASRLRSTSNAKETAKTAGSEDFAYVTHQVPSVMLTLAAGEPSQGHSYPLHHPKVTFDEAVLSTGSAVYAYTAMRWLAEHTQLH